jgi:signal transduction histidine kinase
MYVPIGNSVTSTWRCRPVLSLPPAKRLCLALGNKLRNLLSSKQLRVRRVLLEHGAKIHISPRAGCWLTIALLFPLFLSAQKTKNVLVLHEGNVNHPATLITSAVFREAFGSGSGNQFFEEYIDEDRLDASDEALEASLREKYGNTKMDLVIGDGRPALTFFLQRGEKLWPGIPKVFYFIDSRELPAQLPSNMTGVASTLDYGATLDLALRLEPNTRHVFYVGGVNPWEELWRGFAEQDFKRFGGKLEITYLNTLPIPELLDRLNRLPDNSIVIYSEMLRDASGHVFVPARVCPLIASASNAPVYGSLDSYLGCGIVGGVMLEIKDLAEQTARLGLRALERGTTSGLPVERSQNRAVVDWRQLQRWQISEKGLPADVIVRFRNPTLWQEHKWLLLSALAAIISEFILIIIFVAERRSRKKADLAIENMSGRLINAHEEERRRIAGELHDDIGQRLSLISLDLDVMQHRLLEKEATARLSLEEPLEELGKLITDVHNLSHQLHSNKLQTLGLEVALNETCRQFARQHDVDIQLTAGRVPFPLPEDVGLCFYRVAQEALSNSVKHSSATRVDVRLVASEGFLRMIVKDNGTGFDSSAVANGLGLATMQERLKLVEGKLLVRSTPGRGTKVVAEAKLREQLWKATAA